VRHLKHLEGIPIYDKFDFQLLPSALVCDICQESSKQAVASEILKAVPICLKASPKMQITDDELEFPWHALSLQPLK
jgi:hypothetical protein